MAITKTAGWSKKRRAEKKTIDVVRDAVFRRDYRGCRACVLGIPGTWGPETWAHMDGKRRSQTRGLDPWERHTTAHSLKLCAGHHEHEERHRLLIAPLTERGADGPCRFTYKGQTWDER